MTRLPPSYLAATWRNVTPVDAEMEAIGIGFDLPSGTVRMALALDGARHLAEALTEYLGDYRRAQPHSERGSDSLEAAKSREGTMTNRRFDEDRTHYGVREAHGRDQGASTGRHG